VFWGIITINGVVFALWFMASQRLVRYHYYRLCNVPTAHSTSQKQERDPSSYKWMLDNFTDSWRNLSAGRVYVCPCTRLTSQTLTMC
jgi:hypothetical protein